jgi:hypothetical protein
VCAQAAASRNASCYAAANLHSTGNLEKASANNSLLSLFFTLSVGATGISQQQLLFYKSMNNGAFAMKNCSLVSSPQKMTKTRTVCASR